MTSSAELATFRVLRESITDSGDRPYYDLTINCQGTIFKVHKFIICTRSKPFAAAVSGNWLEGFTNVIELNDDEPEIVSIAIDFMYNGVIDSKYLMRYVCSAEAQIEEIGEDGSINRDFHTNPMLIFCKLYIFADKYDIMGLQDAALIQFQHALSHREVVYNAEAMVASLEQCFQFISRENDTVKRGIYKLACRNMSELLTHEGYCKLVFENPELAKDMTLALHNFHMKNIEMDVKKSLLSQRLRTSRFGMRRNFCTICDRDPCENCLNISAYNLRAGMDYNRQTIYHCHDCGAWTCQDCKNII